MNQKIVHFDNIKYKFFCVPVWIDYIISSNGNIEKKQVSLIGLKDNNSKIYVIHPISEFILYYWKNKEYNTQKKHSNNIVKFLNFLQVNSRKLKITTLHQLKVQHGTLYLNSLTESGLKAETIRDSERTLIYFYRWLSVEKNLDIVNIKETKGVYNEYFISPFEPIYPSKTAKNIEHAFPPEFISLFFEIASLVAKPIALGIYLQFMGGLRIGEVINITRSQIFKTINQNSVLLKLENKKLRPDLKENSSVKKKRLQYVYQYENWYHSLITDHLSLYKPSDNSNALFVNQYGCAMSQRSYRQYFSKVKNKFIFLLINSNDPDKVILGLHLKQIKWSTHIGRGTFSNLLAEFANNPYELSLPRGDSNINSSLTYLQSTQRIKNKLQQKITNMHNQYIPNLVGEDDRVE